LIGDDGSSGGLRSRARRGGQEKDGKARRQVLHITIKKLDQRACASRKPAYNLGGIEHTPTADTHHDPHILFGSKGTAAFNVFKMRFGWDILESHNLAACHSQSFFNRRSYSGRHETGIRNQQYTLCGARTHQGRELTIDSGPKVD
jgi:hypothetical protein